MSLEQVFSVRGTSDEARRSLTGLGYSETYDLSAHLAVKAQITL
jgi:hypothetical protein